MVVAYFKSLSYSIDGNAAEIRTVNLATRRLELYNYRNPFFDSWVI